MLGTQMVLDGDGRLDVGGPGGTIRQHLAQLAPVAGGRLPGLAG